MKELRTMTVEQLNKKNQEARKSLFELRMKNTVGQLNNPIEIRDARKQVARIMTALSGLAAGTVTPKVAAPKTAAKKTVKKTATKKTTKAKATKAKAKKK